MEVERGPTLDALLPRSGGAVGISTLKRLWPHDEVEPMIGCLIGGLKGVRELRRAGGQARRLG